jgi:hypothetical protein
MIEWEPSVDVDDVVLAINAEPEYYIRIPSHFSHILCLAKTQYIVHTSKLNEESYNITSGKEFCQISCLDQTVRLGFKADNDATQCHVYAGRKKGRSDEQQKHLNDIGSESQVWCLLM